MNTACDEFFARPCLAFDQEPWIEEAAAVAISLSTSTIADPVPTMLAKRVMRGEVCGAVLQPGFAGEPRTPRAASYSRAFSIAIAILREKALR